MAPQVPPHEEVGCNVGTVASFRRLAPKGDLGSKDNENMPEMAFLCGKSPVNLRLRNPIQPIRSPEIIPTCRPSAVVWYEEVCSRGPSGMETDLPTRRSAGSRSFCEEATWVVPEVEDLLKEVKMEQYADKFSSLQEFIDVSSFELKTKKDIDTIKHRKLILRQSEIARQLHKLGVINETPRPEPEKEEEEDQTEAVEDGGDADDSMPAKGEEDKI
eukprot:jgi/Bigna1/67287/fgenesh1_pg.3_\